MKHLTISLVLTFVLAACQSQPTPTTVISNPSPVVKPVIATNVIKNSNAPAPTSTPSGPAVHSSSSDPNASNLIIVRDQAIVNNSLTIDSVTAAQVCFVVLYKDKEHQGVHKLGQLVIFAPVPAGKSNQLVILLSQNLNPGVSLAGLPGNLIDVVLQINVSDPHSMVRGANSDVRASFMVLNSYTNLGPSVFSTPTP